MKTVRHTMTLVYYDGLQVFEALDAIGGHYVAVMVEPIGQKDHYLVAGVEPERLRQFRMGSLDLRSLLVERGVREWFLASLGQGLAEEFSLEPQDTPLESFPHLPDAGFFLHDQPAVAEALREARTRNNLVLEFSADPPEALTEHRIRAATLAGLLTHVQSMVKYSYSAAVRKLSSNSRRGVDRADAHLLDVVIPAATGSFRVVMEAAKLPNLFGHSELNRSLEQIDELFTNVSDPQRTLSILKEHRGHLAGSYLRLLRFLVQSKSGLRYAWAEPNFSEPRVRAVSEAEAGPLVDALSSVSNLGAETVVFVGALKKADVDSGAWRLKTIDEDVSGKIKDGGPSLAGLKLESNYRFTCLEEIEEMAGGREQRLLSLTEHEPA
jgi:hypothetical protein